MVGLLFSMSHLQIRSWDYKRWEIHLDKLIKPFNNKYFTTNQSNTPNHNIVYTNVGIKSCYCQHGISSSKLIMQHIVESSVVHRNVHIF